ncbi:methyl coenzyme M reductase system, component A2 [Candidatus Methanomassiliicoccus intestinalis]|uniref:methyl coenzyme M reductase system, component A2 n=1 Tax=Candidatus Methanomassiliicoccus intestinalis TaxID=1406512 RepID=UPI0037DD2B32
MSESHVFITLKDISKSFNGAYVLKNINEEISTGEVFGLIGRSGSGKSVLINMLRGTPEYHPDSGSVIYHVDYCEKCGRVELPGAGKCGICGGPTEARDIDFWKTDDNDLIKKQLRNRIAIMLQRTFALFGDMTVIENIFEALPQGMDEKEKVERSLKLLKSVRLDHRITHIARDLSGGEKQRCVLARQLAKDPIIFLADEPTGTLDPSTADMVHNVLIDAVKNTGMTMIVTSHWPKAIEVLSDRAIWLDRGEIKMRGDSKEIATEFMRGHEMHEESRVEVGQPLIKIDDVKRYYYSYTRGVVKAVDGVSLEVNEREIVGLVGLSGAGKTTLSKMICGLREPSDGKIEVRVGDDWIDMSEPGPTGKGRATQYIGILHQEFSLYPFDTILQNLTVCIGIKLPAELAKMKAIQVLLGSGFDRADVEKILYAYPDNLSVGEKQRVALAQVLIREPRLVILDEPTGTMDPITKNSVAKSVLTARKELGETFLIVSHDMDFVMNCCDRAAIMKDGKIIALGAPADIVEYLEEIELEENANGGAEN